MHSEQLGPATTAGFVHLHVHSEYSALDGMIRVADLFRGVAADAQTAVATTDHGNIAAAWKAQKYADANAVKYIPGCEFYLANGSRHERNPFWVPAEDTSADESSGDGAAEAKATTNAATIIATETPDESAGTDPHAGMKSRTYQHLTVLATKAVGWRNLVLLNNHAQESVWGKPRIDFALLQQHAEGLIVLTGCLGGPVLGPASRGDWEAARAGLTNLIDAVGKDNVYVEIMDHGIPDESAVLPQVVQLAEEFGVRIVATNDAHHTHADGQRAHSGWLLVQSKSSFRNPKFQFHGEGYWLKSEAEMRAIRSEDWWQQACDETVRVADRVAARVVPNAKPRLPAYPTPDGYNSNAEYLYGLIRDGARSRYGEITDKIKSRLRHEFDTIVSLEFVDYFLIVRDVVEWANRNGITTGPGRGSAAGAAVSYCIGITKIDPLKNGLLFERFLEPGRSRTEPPDIDLDFPASRRDDVIAYFARTYGAGNVALIGAYGVSRSRAAVVAAARVLELQGTGRKLADLVPTVEAKPAPFELIMTEGDPRGAEFRSLVQKNPDASEILALARQFEDVAATVGIHASGVIVSAEALFDVVPLRKIDRGWVLQWDGKDAESFGLLKVDVLGLRNLDIALKAVENIEATTGEHVDIDELPDPDDLSNPSVRAAWQVIADGRTAGVFQLESSGITELARHVAPQSLDQLSAVLALYRPGPMGTGMHDAYARRRQGEERVDYRIFTTDPREQAELEKVLGATFGVAVFQEQLMLLGTVVAGFAPAQRSDLRRAVSKKNKQLMAKVGTAFREGGTTEQRDESGNVISIAFSLQTVDTIWAAIAAAAEYAFNKAHSSAYGYLAYITAYLKANWPAEYAAATLACTDKDERRIQTLRTLPAEGIAVLPPDVNLSHADSFPEGDRAVRIGLSEIKGMSSSGQRIVAARGSTPFHSLKSVIDRARSDDKSEIPSDHLQALVESGAVDAFGPRLGHLMVLRVLGQAAVPVPEMEWGITERSQRQRQRLLIPMGEHPLVAMRSQLAAWRPPSMVAGPDRAMFGPQLTPISTIPDRAETIRTIAVLSSWSERSYARGRVANIALEGSNASINGVLWDRELSALLATEDVPRVGEIVSATGRVTMKQFTTTNDDGEESSVTVKELTISGLERVAVNDPASGDLPTFVGTRVDLRPAAVDGAAEDQLEVYPLNHVNSPEPTRGMPAVVEGLPIWGPPPFDGYDAYLMEDHAPTPVPEPTDSWTTIMPSHLPPPTTQPANNPARALPTDATMVAQSMEPNSESLTAPVVKETGTGRVSSFSPAASGSRRKLDADEQFPRGATVYVLKRHGGRQKTGLAASVPGLPIDVQRAWGRHEIQVPSVGTVFVWVGEPDTFWPEAASAEEHIFVA